MSANACTRPIDREVLEAYWLGELEPAESAAIEEHWFGCAICAQRLQQFADLASGVRTALGRGLLQAVVTPAFVEELKRRGMRVREYRVGPGQRVACTIAAEDDAVVGRMAAPLAGVGCVDLLQAVDLGGGRVEHGRAHDVPYDPASGEVVSMPAAAALRAMPAHTVHVRLVAVDGGAERLLGEYTFVHTPP